MRYPGDEATINKSFNANCPACVVKRIHQPDEWDQHHPITGKDFSREHGTPKPKSDK